MDSFIIVGIIFFALLGIYIWMNSNGEYDDDIDWEDGD